MYRLLYTNTPSEDFFKKYFWLALKPSEFFICNRKSAGFWTQDHWILLLWILRSRFQIPYLGGYRKKKMWGFDSTPIFFFSLPHQKNWQIHRTNQKYFMKKFPCLFCGSNSASMNIKKGRFIMCQTWYRSSKYNMYRSSHFSSLSN